jgi:lysophospholipase L1-like esterase
MNRPSRGAAACALAAVAFGTGVLALEGLVRAFLPQQLIHYRPELYREDPRVGWRFAPHLDTSVDTGERETRLRTDAHGRRIGDSASPVAARRVLAVGDSFVAGLQVEHADLFVSRLAAQLTGDLGEPVEVVAEAAPGWSPEQYARVVEDELDRERYDAVAVFLFLGNDVVERRSGSFGIEEFRRRFGGELRWPRALDGPELRAALRPLDDRIEERSHLYVLVKSRLEEVRMRLGLSPVSIPRTLLRARAGGPEWERTAAICAELADSAGGTPVLFVLLPANYQVDRELFDRHVRWLRIDPGSVDLEQPSRLLRAALGARGLEASDSTPALVEAWRAGHRRLYGRVDAHLEPDGHRIVSEWLAPLLEAKLRRAARFREGSGGAARRHARAAGGEAASGRPSLQRRCQSSTLARRQSACGAASTSAS